MNPTVTAITTYLTFNGNCREAMNYYKDCLGAELQLVDFEGTPMPVSEESKKKILHSSLIKNNLLLLMASDAMPGQPSSIGTNITLSVNCASREEADMFYNSLVKGGKAMMPLQDTFWGAYFGMLVDKFGVQWMFNVETSRK